MNYDEELKIFNPASYAKYGDFEFSPSDDSSHVTFLASQIRVERLLGVFASKKYFRSSCLNRASQRNSKSERDWLGFCRARDGYLFPFYFVLNRQIWFILL